MTTIVNSPTPAADNSGSGFLIGVLVLVGLGLLFVYFGLPAIRRMGPIEVNVPAAQINVPDKIDVNVQPAE
ncbi:MAG: hypothetical protein WC841_05540 [Candidatus Shapirobacteria bacterium]|jgi:hypothetical protein